MTDGSGKEVLLPAPPSLRTGRASFPASGSSLLQRLSRDAAGFCPHFLAMSLPVAVGVEQHQVVQAIAATVGSPYPVVQVPRLLLPQGLAAPGATSLLLLPQVVDPSSTR